MRFVRALWLTSLKSAVAQPSRFWLQIALMFANNVGFCVFWWALFRRVGSLRGWRLQEVLLLFGLTTSAFGLMAALAGGVRQLSRFIDDGDLDPLLVQPKSTWLYAVCSRGQASGLGDVLSGVVFMVLSGHVHVTNALLVMVCCSCGACIFLGVALAFYSLAFWFPRTETSSRQALDFLVLFCLYPESLFKGVMRGVLFTVLPAGFIAYLPVQIVREGRWLALPILMAAAAVFLTLGVQIFNRGLRRYASGSRFGVWG